MSFYYLTASTKNLIGDQFTEEEIVEIFTTNINKYIQKYDKHINILEHGKNGDNPHFNVIISSDGQDPSNCRRLFKNAIYTKHGFPLSEHSVDFLTVYDLPTLVCGYLDKEDECKVLLNKGFDLQQLKTQVKHKPKKTDMKLINVTIGTFPFIFHKYVSENDIIYTYDNFGAIFQRMFNDGYNILPLAPKAKLLKTAVATFYGQNDLELYINQLIDKEEHFITTNKVTAPVETYKDFYWENYLEGVEFEPIKKLEFRK